MINIVIIGLVILVIGLIYLIVQSKKQVVIPSSPVIQVNLDPLEKKLDQLPNKILQSIQGSVNNKKGALGELIGYLELKAEYDRIIPLGNITDFIGIKFSTPQVPGKIDFIDVKTGKSARLSDDQKAFRDLIKERRINFLTIKIDQEDAP